MNRAKVGPKVSRWWWLWAVALVVLLVGNIRDGQWASAVMWPALVCAGATEYARSLRQRNLLVALGAALGVLAALLGVVLHDLIAVALGVLLAVALALFVRKMLRDVPTNRFPTEELVGRTVAEATHLIGYDQHRQPGDLQQPVLIPLPDADLDLTDPAVVVTAVSVDAESKSVTFGVAAPGSDLGEGREELQRQLNARTGGGAADIRPLRFPIGGLPAR